MRPIDADLAIAAIWKALHADTDILSAVICGGIAQVLNGLPPVQPKLTEEEWKLIKKLRSFHNGTYAKVLDKLITYASAQPTPCDVCRHNPPSSMDGKPCCVCPAERREE